MKYDHSNKNHKLKDRGMQLSSKSQNVQEDTIKYINDFFSKRPNDIMLWYINIQDNMLQEIKDVIETHNIVALSRYCKVINNSMKSQVCIALRNRYPHRINDK